uniref:undecaprenyl-diphosphate phosphatase n=1 Tax=Porphyromonas loveana TaxID=1884669 RepID=UPI0035A0081F
MTVLQAIVLAIVEGLTEFLPVSSTGHMIITEGIMGMQSTPFVKAFTVMIQFGAILSVLVLVVQMAILAWGFGQLLDHQAHHQLSSLVSV